MNKRILGFYYGALARPKEKSEYQRITSVGKKTITIGKSVATSYDNIILKLRSLEDLKEEELIKIAKYASTTNWKKYKVLDLTRTESALFKVVNYHNEDQEAMIIYKDGTIKKLSGISQYPMNQPKITKYLLGRYFDLYNLIEKDLAEEAKFEDYFEDK